LIYLDTSALGAIYFPEPYSDAVERIALAEPVCGISDLSEVELFSATSRRLRMRELTRHEADAVATSFRADLAADVFAVLPVTSSHFRHARGLIARFDTPLRTLDAMHLSVAAGEGLELLTLDRAMANSARRLGIKVRRFSR
jgi:predicted nucleic acid-binding protein